MTLIEMVEVISLKERIPKTRVKRVLKALFHEVRSVAMSDECVKLLGLGRFEKKVIKPKMMFGKMTKERVTLKFTPFGERHGQVRRSNR